MDAGSRTKLVQMLHETRVAALGTLREGSPLVSQVLFVAAPDLSEFYLHVSGLAYHTQDMVCDPRVSLLVAETDTGDRDPQTLARVSLVGEAVRLDPASPAHASVSAARAQYLHRFPESRITFSLGDFGLFAVRPAWARYVAGFGKTYNLRPEDITAAGRT